MDTVMLVSLTTISLLLTAQALHALCVMLYTWDQPSSRAAAMAPNIRVPPSRSFTAILPARHEEAVIATTIRRVAQVNYPPRLLQVLIVCSADDPATIERARQEIEELQRQGSYNLKVIVFDGQPINKPHGLNCGLMEATGDVITVFDAEDEIHPDLLNIVNTVMQTDNVNVVQGGVQLMNFESNWYSTFNVLEYFFWFRSRLHYNARVGATPLGGNTVFVTHDLLRRLGGWDEANLTEDADLGLRISALGERVRIIYDDRYVTKEETPPTLAQFVRQRTRWNQGFMQTLRKGTWRRLPTFRQRALAFYTLAFPHAQAWLGLYLPLAFGMAFFLDAPVPVALLSWLPVLLLAAHLVLNVVGLREFAAAHGLRVSWLRVPVMAITWLPYQFVLAISALRALHRHLRGVGNWEKTGHVGAHRPEPHPEPSRVGSPAESG
jgi:glycosyltransferase XagB